MPATSQTLSHLFDRLWAGYAAITPQAERILALLEARGETVRNDHVAIRTFDCDAVSIDVIARPFVARGYKLGGDYAFPDKRVVARHFQHPDEVLPKVFISELRVAEFSPSLQRTVQQLVAHIPDDMPHQDDFCASGRPWPIDFSTYEALRHESEYAAWVAAFGFCANHFTVDVGALDTFSDLGALNAFIVGSGYLLNDSGGAIKGGPDVLLEQSSTRADRVDVAFSDGIYRIPSCYYEFAKRYPLPNGELFQGFVAASADKIFESTDHHRG